MRYLRITLTTLLLASFTTACGNVDTSADKNNYQIVNPGKSDNYYSDKANEYELTGTIPVEMTEKEYEDKKERKKIVERRLTAVGLYLTAYVTEKIEDMFDNMDYGKFHAMVRNQSYEKQKLIGDADSGYRVKFSIDVAGPQNFKQLLLENGADKTQKGVTIGLKMPEGATSDPNNVDRQVPRNFSQSSYSGELETVEMTVEKHPTIDDSYPYYESFIKDGVYDITHFYGHDYNEQRSDLKGSKEMFKRLERLGFKPAVQNWDSLQHDSGAFVKRLTIKDSPSRETCIQRRALATVNQTTSTKQKLIDKGVPPQTAGRLIELRNGPDGRVGTVDDKAFQSLQKLDDANGIGSSTIEALESIGQHKCRSGSHFKVEVRVHMFHSNMFKQNRQYQHDLALDELARRDVFFYNGHAGPYYGFYLDPNDEAEVTHHEIEAAKLRQDRKQLFIAQGCQTYSQYADMLYNNPAKSEQNLDVITTVNYSYGLGTKKLFEQLVQTKSSSNVHKPATFYDLVSTLNDKWYNDRKQVFYGVMGLDKNQQVHPYANTGSIGSQCRNDRRCGSNTDANLCVSTGMGGSECVARTLGRDCPAGTTFGYLGQGNQLEDGICH